MVYIGRFIFFFSDSRQGIHFIAVCAACDYLQGKLAALNNAKIFLRGSVP